MFFEVKAYNPVGKIFKILLSIGAGIFFGQTYAGESAPFYWIFILSIICFLAAYLVCTMFAAFYDQSENPILSAVLIILIAGGIQIGLEKLFNYMPVWLAIALGGILGTGIAIAIMYYDIRSIIEFYEYRKYVRLLAKNIRAEIKNTPPPSQPAARRTIFSFGKRSTAKKGGAALPDYSSDSLRKALVPNGTAASISDGKLSYIAKGMTLGEIHSFYLKAVETLQMEPLSKGFEEMGDPNIWAYGARYRKGDESFYRNLTIIVQRKEEIQVSVYFSALSA